METEELIITDKASVIARNKCSNCDRLLNVSPIYCLEMNGGAFQKICGRCASYVKNFSGKKVRQNAYEDLAECMTYPCSNKLYGCSLVLLWENIVTHEAACKYQFTPCLLHSKELFPGRECSWVGNVRLLEEHIENVHKEHLMKSQIQLSFDGFCETKIFFTYVSKKLVTVLVKYESQNKYHCLLMINGNDMESQCYQYQLELFNEDKTKSIILRKSRLESLGHIDIYLKNKESLLEIDLEQVKNLIGPTDNLRGCFGIVRNKRKLKQLGKDGSSTKAKVQPLEESVLQELECPVCNQYMVSKIYICHAGHSICQNCKERVVTCPICRSEFSKTRNYTLEKLTSKVNYPCRNREIGCSFATTADKIRVHEAICELTETPCLLMCGYKCLRPKMFTHMTEQHSAQILELDISHKRDIFTEKKNAYYVLHFNGELFRFSIAFNNEYKFNIQHLGTIDDDPMFRYQMDFIDPGSHGRNLSFSFFCQSLTEYPEQAHKSAVSLHWDLLKSFCDGRYLYYKISIVKL